MSRAFCVLNASGAWPLAAWEFDDDPAASAREVGCELP